MCRLIARYLVFLATISTVVFTPGCSEDSVSPEPEPEPSVLVVGISYYGGENQELKYLEKTGESWGKPEVVVSEGRVGEYSSLAIDSRGKPHVAYHDGTNHDLMYAVRSEHGWDPFAVDSKDNVGLNCSIALDARGNPHIAYMDLTNGMVKYASNTGGSWTTQTVPESQTYTAQIACREDYGHPITLAIDASGTPHISYYTAAGHLGYITRANNEWVVVLADALGNVGHASSLSLDAQGNPHISYLQHATHEDRRLKYARNIHGSWDPETVSVIDAVNICSFPTDIAVDANGVVHICYFTVSGKLGYATKSPGTSWAFDLADQIGDVGKYCSIVLDAQGTPHISYWDSTSDDLKCAVRVDNGWDAETIDGSPVGMYTSIALAYR